MHKRQSIVDKMRSWLGCHEGDATHKHIIDTYNSYRPLPKGYKVKYTDAWCAATASAAAIECGYTDIIPVECSCNRLIELFQKMGCWVEDDAYTPDMGDWIFYDWQDNGIGDDTDPSEHVGVVEKVKDDKITVIEGNKSDGVNERTLNVNGKYIRGYGVPKYDDKIEVAPVQPKRDYKYGLDVSAYQASVDFNEVKNAGFEFVLFRSTTKNGKPDVKLDEYWNAATAAGMKIVGVYKLCYAHSAWEAQKEAEGVIKLLKSKGRKCDIWLDMEGAGGQQIYNKDIIAGIVTAFLTTCVNAGFEVGIYCNMDWYENHIRDDIKKICRFWIARPPKEDTGTLCENLRPNMKGVVMWQYSSKGNLPGIPGNVDLNVLY